MTHRSDAGSHDDAADASDSPAPPTAVRLDRRRGEPPSFRPFGFPNGARFMHDAVCRNGHAIGGDAAWIEDQPDIHVCRKQLDRTGQPCGEWTWLYRFRGNAAIAVPIRSSEIDDLRKAKSPGEAFVYLGIFEQVLKLWLWLNVA